MTRLYVGNLSYDTKEDELQELFSSYGRPESVRIMTDRDTGRSKGFGFVEFANDEEAKAAITGLHGKELHGRRLTVDQARARTEGGGRSGSGGRGGFGGGGFRGGERRGYGRY